MTVLNHAATGAIVALLVKQPAIAFPMAFASHFVLDGLPHYGVPDERRREFVSFKRVLALDTLISPIFVLLMFMVTGSWVILLAAFLAVSPDFFWIGHMLHTKQHYLDMTLPQDPFSRFHKRIQWGERPWAWPIDLLYGVVALTVIVALLY